MTFCSKCVSEREIGTECSPCQAAYFKNYNRAHTERISALKKQWHDNHRDEVRDYQREYQREYSKNPDVKEKKRARKAADWKSDPSIRERLRAWAKDHPEQVRAQKKRHYEKHKERITKQNEAWRARNPDLVTTYKERARLKRLSALGSHTQAEWRLILRKFDFTCQYCGKRGGKLTKDHVIPLSKGGSDFAYNIVPACQPCNTKKLDSIPLRANFSLFDRVAE